MPRGVAELERLIGHSFRDVSLLERAITHRSWAFENLQGADAEAFVKADNEVLEFLGDSVIGLAIAEALYETHPGLDEGGLTLMKHHLVSTATIADVAQEIGLGVFLRVGRGEEKTGGRQKQALLADGMEAVIGAVFLDSGYIAARAMIKRLFAAKLKEATPERSLDYKSLLQETLQADRRSAPTYTLLRSEGAPHQRTFYVAALWDTGRAEGEGPSIKAAEMTAARNALDEIKGSTALPAK